MFPVKRDSKRDPIGEWDEILLRVSCWTIGPRASFPIDMQIFTKYVCFQTLPITVTFGSSFPRNSSGQGRILEFYVPKGASDYQKDSLAEKESGQDLSP